MSTFINFQQSTLRPDLVSTQAVGEEGGDERRYTTQAVGEEGGDATTAALGEEGGDERRYTTQALGEEGGDATTLAVGEEGGEISTRALGEEGGDITTLAVGEEGGGFPPDDRTSRRTQDYIDFLREADRGPYGQWGDGQLTRDEVVRQLDTYKAQTGFLRQLAGVYEIFFPAAKPFFDRMIEQIDAKARVGQRMLDNFTTFAQGSPYGPRPYDNSNTISLVDLQRLSERDGNRNDISDLDIGRRFPIRFRTEAQQ